jgi:hypothetical protein
MGRASEDDRKLLLFTAQKDGALSQDASSKKKSPSSVERESGPFFFWVQHWVQLGPVLGSFFGVKRRRINE